MSTTRTDCHRPSAIVPNDYQYVACEYTRGDFSSNLNVCESERTVLRAHQAHTGGHTLHEEGSPCDVCGSPKLVYGLMFHHRPSNVYVRVGEDCAHKLGLGGSGKFNAFKRTLREQAEVYAGKAKAQRILAEAGLTRCYEIAMAADRKGFAYEEGVITDIVGKLIRYGSISERQQEFIGKLLVKIDERAAKQAQRAAENEAAADFPITDARIEITGTVLSLKLQESDFGSTWKMLVKSEAGWKIWVTASGNPQKGDKVRFFAKVQPSGNDPKFGFGSRPTKLTVIEEAAQAVS